jgi:DNA modification methylase
MGVDAPRGSRRRLGAVNNDTVEETAAMADNSVGLIFTSIPFSTQYEYTPSYNDFGHTDDKRTSSADGLPHAGALPRRSCRAVLACT